MSTSTAGPMACEPRTAFVLAGGTALGAMQAGMVHALYERGIAPDLLIGTSAGALNAGRLERSGYQSGCAIATLVLELAPRDEQFSAELDAVFARWRAALAASFEPLGLAPGRAAALAGLTISAIEGVLVLSRAARSTEPFDTTIEALISAIDHDAAAQPAAP
jgi:hypothetical protein